VDHLDRSCHRGMSSIGTRSASARRSWAGSSRT